MKYIQNLLYILCLFGGVACSNSDEKVEDAFTLSLDDRLYISTYTPFEVKLISSELVPTDLEIPFAILTNTAIESVDYTISDHKFLLKAGTKEASIVIAPKEVDKDKSLTISLGELPKGIGYGLFKEARVFLGQKTAIVYTFDSPSMLLGSNNYARISFFNTQGKTFRVTEVLEIPIEIDLDESTAIEGVHFNIPDKNVIVPYGENTGICLIEWLSYENDKNKIVLRSPNPFSFIKGDNVELIINITSSSFNQMVGTWKYIGPPAWNREWWQYMWGQPAEGFPAANEGDKLIITEDHIIIPQFTSDLKDFFVQETPFEYIGQKISYFEDLSFPPTKVNLDVILFEAVNANYSPTNTKLRSSKAGYRLLKEGENDILELTLDDFEPIDGYFKDVYELMGTMEYSPVRFHFTRIEDEAEEE